MVPAVPVASPKVIRFILSSQVKLLLVVVVFVALLNKILFAVPTTFVATDDEAAMDDEIAYEAVPNNEPVIPPKAFNEPLTVNEPVISSTLDVMVCTTNV